MGYLKTHLIFENFRFEYFSPIGFFNIKLKNEIGAGKH